jgi:hypothetical protein
MYNVLVGKPDGKSPLGRSRRRWEDNIRMNLREMRWHGVDWIYLVQDRDKCQTLVKTVMKLRVPSDGDFIKDVTMQCRNMCSKNTLKCKICREYDAI